MPNVCKMPGPPAPFVPTPLPNIGQSGKQPDGYSTTVKVEGEPVAIAGASFGSSGDIASKGTGGGIVSNNAEGPTKFLAPGSLNVQIEGKNVQYLGDQMFNNCGPGGSPPNAATMAGVLQAPNATLGDIEAELQQIAKDCEEEVEGKEDMKGKSCRQKGKKKHECCDRKIEEDRSTDTKAPQRTYSEGAFDKKSGSAIPRKNPASGGVPPVVPRKQSAMVRGALGFARSLGAGAALTKSILGGALSGKQFPDVVVASDPSQAVGRGNVSAVYDFKFPCPKDKKPKWGKGKQGDTYDRMLRPKVAPKMITPTMIV